MTLPNSKLMMRGMLGKVLQTHRVNNSQLTFTCSKSTIETLEKGVKYIQS